MLDNRNKEQKAYVIQNKDTGKIHLTYESYAKKLSKQGKANIIANEDDKDFKRKIVKTEKAEEK